MSIASVFLINGVYHAESLTSENQEVLIMGKVLQSNMEIALNETDSISAQTYFFDDYLVKMQVEPFNNKNLYILHMTVISSSGAEVNACAVYHSQAE